MTLSDAWKIFKINWSVVLNLTLSGLELFYTALGLLPSVTFWKCSEGGLLCSFGFTVLDPFQYFPAQHFDLVMRRTKCFLRGSRQTPPVSAVDWWRVNSCDLATQKGNHGNSDLGGTVRSKYPHHRFCQGACACVVLIWETISLAGFVSCTDGMWLTELSCDSGFSLSILGPGGDVWIFLGPRLFSSLPRKDSSQMVFLVTCSLWRGLLLFTWIMSNNGWSQWSRWQGLPFEKSCLAKS